MSEPSEQGLHMARGTMTTHQGAVCPILGIRSIVLERENREGQPAGFGPTRGELTFPCSMHRARCMTRSQVHDKGMGPIARVRTDFLAHDHAGRPVVGLFDPDGSIHKHGNDLGICAKVLGRFGHGEHASPLGQCQGQQKLVG